MGIISNDILWSGGIDLFVSPDHFKGGNRIPRDTGLDESCLFSMQMRHCSAGASIPSETMMHFPPLFQISPYFRKNFELWRNLSKFYFFPKNFFIFIRRNFWWPFLLVIDHKFRIFPLFSLFPTLTNFPSVLDKLTCCLHTLPVFRFPPTLTMMHLCITQCTYWTPLLQCFNTLTTVYAIVSHACN